MSQLIFDKNKSIWFRMGDQILPISAMEYWDGKLVVGCGSDDGDEPNLLYFDKTRYQEKGNIISNTAVDNTIISVNYSKAFDLKTPDIQKRLTSVGFWYVDSTDYSDYEFTLDYMVDGDDWINIDTVSLGTDNLTHSVVKNITPPSGYSTLGHYFQFRITCEQEFEILGYMPYFELTSRRAL